MKRIEDLWRDAGIGEAIPLSVCPVRLGEKNKVHIAALGDVGTTLLLGLRLLGGDVISQIGIFDMNGANMERLEMEMNQISYPDGEPKLPPVKCIRQEEVFQCDVFVFCASKGVPPLGSSGDVRMAQLAANREIAAHYGRLAASADFRGLAAVVSDPVDPLCKTFWEKSGLHPAQIQGYGLGVMNARARYFAQRDQRLRQYIEEGRAFGPHGEDLVIADSIACYNDGLSAELTKKTVEANVAVRELGFKPYIAPAMSSAALSILLTLRGDWHYGSIYLGDQRDGAFFGVRNRMTEEGPVYEDLPLCEELFARLQRAYDNLRRL